jgi:hypothetical protein
MPPNPKTGLVTLPEVVMSVLAGKFGEISLFDQHADFELGSASNSNSTSLLAIVRESATKPLHADSPPHERFTRGPRNVSMAHTKAPTTRRAGKEPVPEYDSDSNTAPGCASDCNPLFGFYSDFTYEFDFGSDPEEPESEDNTTEQPLSGPASGLVITSTPAGRLVYWPNRKPADLTDGNSRYVADLDSLLFQEGTPLARAEEYTPTEVASSGSSLGNPDCQVFMAAGDTPGPSGTTGDRYLEDISANELFANAPADETDANRDARRERNRKWNERRRCLRDNLPIHNLAEALDQVESRVHTTRSNASCRSQQSRAKLRGCAQEKSSPSLQKTLTSCELTTGSLSRPPPGTATTKPQVAVRTSVLTVLELSCRPIPTVLMQRPTDPLKVATALRLLAAIVRSSLIATLAAEAATVEAPTMGLTGGPMAEAIVAADATRTATSPEPHTAASTPTRRLKNCNRRSPPP